MGTSKHRITVVDDEPSVRKALARLIRSFGMDVDTFPSGVAFLESLTDQSPDCVVLDLHMPGLTGLDVQARLALSGSAVPVLIMTGHDVPEARSQALASGAHAYLLKPVDEKVLLDAIVDALQSNRGTN